MVTSSDYNGDGKTEISVLSYGTSTQSLLIENLLFTGWNRTINIYTTSFITPFIGDFNGDGKADIGMFRKDTKTWYFDLTYNSFGSQDSYMSLTSYIGNISNKIVSAVATDYDGDGIADLAVFVGDSTQTTVYILLTKEKFYQVHSYVYSINT